MSASGEKGARSAKGVNGANGGKGVKGAKRGKRDNGAASEYGAHLSGWECDWLRARGSDGGGGGDGAAR